MPFYSRTLSSPVPSHVWVESSHSPTILTPLLQEKKGVGVVIWSFWWGSSLVVGDYDAPRFHHNQNLAAGNIK